MAKGGPWQRLMREAKDKESVMRVHALSLLCFADGIQDDIAEALQKGGRLTYTIQVSEPETADMARKDEPC